MPQPDRHRRHRRLPAPAALAALAGMALSSCIFDERTAGTSTTITNPSPTVFGAAIFLGGPPAKGTRVYLRSVDYLLTAEGRPYAKVAAQTTVDDTGGFAMPMPMMMREHYLIFEQADTAIPLENREVQLRRWPDGMPRNGYMGTFRLANPGGVRGVVAMGDTSADSTRWIGDRGTENFTAVGKDGSFTLTRMAPGEHFLTLITVPAGGPFTAGAKAVSVVDFLGRAEVKPDTVIDVGEIKHTDS